MYRECSITAGTPERVYRGLGEIRDDIKRIAERIKETNRRLNLRSILLDIVDVERAAGDNPAIWIPELTDAIDEARSAYESLSELREELSCLREELREARWAMCV